MNGPTPQGNASPTPMPDRVLSMDVPGIAGELGIVPVPGGGSATTYGMTISDPRLNEGRPTNVPFLARGQENVEAVLGGQRPSDRQFEIAIMRALQRQKAGETVPSYENNEQAIAASKGFSAQEGRRGDYLESLRKIQQQLSGGRPGPYPSLDELMNAAKAHRLQQER
jgi:hypothetical protein